jgi:16S rRNA (guanine527-N7)-methyltransferase
VTLICSVESISALDVPRETAERIAAWTVVLDRWQKAQRLVGWKRPVDLLREGIADAVAVLPLLDDVPPGPWMDLGSGSGLPALILAAAHPEQELHLVEARRKRCAFLRSAAIEMGLPHVVVHHGRAEDLIHDAGAPRPVLLSARAFVPPEQLPAHAEAWGATHLLVSSSRARLPKGGWPAPWSLHVEHPGRPAAERRHLLLVRSEG